jgi:hypothetical protein
MTADERPTAEAPSKTLPKPNRHWFIAILLSVHLLICLLVLANNASHPKTSDRLVSSDSVHYVDIARDFSSGDFSMAYVKERPHRQPLYPALLAVAMKIGGGNRFLLGIVNVLIDSASILLIYVFTLRLFAKRLVASVVALALAANPFLDRLVTARLLTEPLHLPLVWTNLSNPTSRVPYGSTLPFELFLAALFLAWLSANSRVRAWFVNRFGTAVRR